MLEMAKVMEMVTAMAKVMVLETEMKQQTVTAMAKEKWIAMARETESLAAMATVMPRQRQALPAKANLEAAKDIATAVVEDVVARSFPR